MTLRPGRGARLPGALSAAVTLVVGLLLLAGCSAGAGAGSSPPGALAVVVGAHANMVAPTVTEAVREEIVAAAELGSDATVVVVDGAPTVTARVSLATENNNPLYQQARINQFVSVVEQARADTPEVDLLAALSLAARSVADAAGPKTIVVIDSGLQTAGALRFQDQGGALLEADPSVVVDRLRSGQQLPDLTGIRVVFAGLGDTAPPQEPLPLPARRSLVDLWTAIIEAAGGTVQVNQAPLPGSRSLRGVPPVTPVPVETESISLPATTVLEDSTVGFIADQARFRNPDKARAVLAPYAEAIEEGKRALLIGTTSSAGTPQGRRTLSLQRANAVKALLVELGAPAARIETRGLGSDFPGYVPDRDAQGNLVPARAVQNRQVIIKLR